MNDNPHSFEDTYNLLSLLQEKKIETYYSLTVVSELAYVLIKYYKVEKEIVVYYINSLFVNYRKLDEYNLSLAMKLYNENNVKYGDAIISSNSEIQAGRVTIVSYDRDFDKLGVIRKEPRQVIKEINDKTHKSQTLKPEAYSPLAKNFK